MNLLAIFDNDGTICDIQEVEGACYARAIEHVTGRSLSTLDWMSYEEPTSTAIVRNLLAGDPAALAKEKQIEREFVRLLEQDAKTQILIPQRRRGAEQIRLANYLSVPRCASDLNRLFRIFASVARSCCALAVSDSTVRPCCTTSP